MITSTKYVMESSGPSESYVAGVHYVKPGGIHSIGLYFMEGKGTCELPPVPFRGGIRSRCQCISLNRKIYVLGGAVFSHFASQEVFVFDLDGKGQWLRCAGMQMPRMNFGVGTLNGRIYAFGGLNQSKPVDVCEVYDPKIDVWSKIEGMLESRFGFQVAAVQQDLFLYGGFIDTEGLFASRILVYHTVKNLWRSIEQGGKHWDYGVFRAQESFYRLTRDARDDGSGHDGINLYDVENGSWSRSHSFFGTTEGLACFDLPDGLVLGHQTIPLGKELLTVSNLPKNPKMPATTSGACLLQTRCFNPEKKETDIWLDVARVFQGEFETGTTQIFPVHL